jgi:putative transposase
MQILRAYKTELDPNDVQRTFFHRCAGAARWVYNWALADRKSRYEEHGLNTSMYEQSCRLNATKDELAPWLRETPYAVQEKAIRDLDAAFTNFFRRVKHGEKPGYPKFKSRHTSPAKFSLRNAKVEEGRVRLTGIGWVRLKEQGYLPTEGPYGLYAVVSEQAGRWFVSVLVEEEVAEPVQGKGILGVDLGVKSLAVCSDGTVFENPKALYKAERKLKRLEREKSRRQKGGRNRAKTVRKLQRCHAKIVNIRKHALHQVSHYVTVRAKPHVVVIEDLNVLGMEQNHHLAKAISDVGMGELRRQIEYKAKWYGIKVMVADRWYPSSKTCSECGATNQVLTLSDRVYVCPACGCIIDRDLNAARNLASLAA